MVLGLRRVWERHGVVFLVGFFAMVHGPVSGTSEEVSVTAC
jgi:hypothetical protein